MRLYGFRPEYTLSEVGPVPRQRDLVGYVPITRYYAPAYAFHLSLNDVKVQTLTDRVFLECF
jgi:hypothetical protein